MTHRTTTATAVIAAACLAASATAAPEAGREAVHAAVKYDDLNLANAAGRTTLKLRIDHAIRRACSSSLSGMRGAGDAARCRDEMLRDADAQVAAMGAGGSPIAVAARR